MIPDREGLSRGLWRLSIGVLIVVFLVSVYTDVGRLRTGLLGLDWRMLVAALGLTLANQTLRFVKWEYLLRSLDIDIPVRSSAVVFGSALVMIMSPGKLGEAWKSWQLRDRHGVGLLRSLPVIAAERLTDLLGVAAIAIVGAYAFSQSLAGVVLTLGLVLGGVAVLRSRRLCGWCFDQVEKIPLSSVTERMDDVRRLYDASYRVLRVRILAVTGLLSVLSWGFECLGLWLIVGGFDVEVSVLAAAFTFAFSSVVGALSLLPGGLGATGGSMTLLLVETGLPRDTAVGATILTRLATLWFSVGLSVVVLATQFLSESPDADARRHK